MILLVNVLNTIPEDMHQRTVFAFLAEHLNPLGWLVVYQRVWAEGEPPDVKIPYGDGWLVPQTVHNYHTYRGKTGAKWFTACATAAGLHLHPVTNNIRITSANTLLRVWKRPFDQ
jgi:hypothetical protein